LKTNSASKTASHITRITRQKLVSDRLADTSRREAPRHALQTSLVFPYRLAAHPMPPGATPVVSLLLVFRTLEQVLKNPKHSTYNP